MPSWTHCPVCAQRNPPHTMRCTACGADFSDPDVQALAGVDASSLDLGASGSLASSVFLGVSEDGLTSGTSLRSLAVVGAALAGLGFLLPVSTDFVELGAAWNAGGPTFALWFPVVALLAGVVVAALPRIAPLHRAGLLTAVGVVGLLTLPSLAALGGAPEKALVPLTLGLALVGTGLVLRLMSPHSQPARLLVAAGAIATVAGLLLPVGDADSALPVELRFYLDDALGTAPPAQAYTTVFQPDPTIVFVTLLALLPLLVAPIAAGLAWPRPSGAWDRLDLVLRPLAWLCVLYWPLSYALSALNVMGWDYARSVIIDHRYISVDDFTTSALAGRLRVAVLALGYALWAQLPAVTLHHALARRPETDDGAP